MNVQPDDDVTLFDGRGGIVIGIDGGMVTFLPPGGDPVCVPTAWLATINQQETRPRSGAFLPPDVRPLVLWSPDEVRARYPKAGQR